MIESLIRDFSIKAKAQTGASEELVLWIFVVAILSVIAVVFLSVAAYVWLADLYGGAIAGTAVGCFHILIVSAALTRCVAVRRRNKSRALAAIEAAAKQHAWWSDPSVLAIGIEVAKMIGWRKVAPFVAAGVFAASLSGGRGERSRRASSNGSH
jgi:hypothetical protein